MTAKRPRVRRSTSSHGRSSRTPSSPDPQTPPPTAYVRPSHLPVLPEAPHTHLVCRSCGRIVEVALQFDQHQRLEQLIALGPSDWHVDRLTVSMMGLCPRCQRASGV